MRVLLFAFPAFFEDPRHDRPWAESFGAELARLGHEVTRFDPESSHVRGHDLIHVLGHQDLELLTVLRKFDPSLKIVVTPGGAPEPSPVSRSERLVARALRLSRAAVQHRWPPVDEFSAFQHADRVLVTSTEWERCAYERWRVPPARVALISSDPIAAARISAQAYT